MNFAMLLPLLAGCYNSGGLSGDTIRPYEVSWDFGTAGTAGSATLPFAHHRRYGVQRTRGCEPIHYTGGGGTSVDGFDFDWQLPLHDANQALVSTDLRNVFVHTDTARFLRDGSLTFEEQDGDVTWQVIGTFCATDGGPCVPGSFTLTSYVTDNDHIAEWDSRPGPWSSGGDLFCEPVF